MHLEERVLVTGGAGFLGSHLCERLLGDGAVVVCVDNFFTGARRNVEHLLEHKHFEVIRRDVTFPLYVEVDEISRSGANDEDKRPRRNDQGRRMPAQILGKIQSPYLRSSKQVR